MKITTEWINVSHSIGAPFGGMGTGYGVLGKYGFVLPNFNSIPCVGRYDRYCDLPNYDYLDLHGNDRKNFLRLHIKNGEREYAFQSEVLDDTTIPADTFTSYSFLPFTEHVAEYNEANFRVGMLTYSPLIAYDISESSIPALCMEICITNQSDRDMDLELSFMLSEQCAGSGMKVGFADGSTVCKVQLRPGERTEVVVILAWYYPEFQTPSAVMTEVYHRYYTLRFDGVEAVWQYALEHRDRWKQRMLRWQASFECPAEFKRLWFASLSSVITSSMLSTDPYFFEIESPHPFVNTMDVTIYSAWIYLVNWPEIEKMDMYEYRKAIPKSGEDQGFVWHSLWSDRADYVEEPCYLTRIYRDYLWFNDKKFLKDMQRPVQDALNRIYKQSLWNGLVESKHGNQSYDVWKMPGISAYVNMPWLYALYSVMKMNAAIGSDVQPGEKNAAEVLDEAKSSFVKYLWDNERGYFHCFYRTEGGSQVSVPESAFTDHLFGRWLLLIERNLDALLPMEMIRKSAEFVYHNNLIDDPEHDFRGWSNGRLPDGTPCMDQKQHHVKSCWIGAQLNMGSVLGELGDENAAMDVFASLERSLHNNHLAVGEWNQTITEDAKSCISPEEPSKDTPRFPAYPRYKSSWEYLIRILGLKVDEKMMELHPFHGFDFAIHDVILAGCELNVSVQRNWNMVVVDGETSEKAVFERIGDHKVEFVKV